jgi:dipeptidyl aminopeptidase/acylaminoacyl peptidase
MKSPALRSRRAARLVLVIALVASVGWVAIRQRPAGAAAVSDFTQVQDFAISPAGTLIAFTVRLTANGELPGLYVANRDGSGAVRLADDGRNPDFSPDSQRIIFTRPTGGGGHDVFVIPVTGGVPSDITNSPVDEEQPRYSPDGATVVGAHGANHY